VHERDDATNGPQLYGPDLSRERCPRRPPAPPPIRSSWCWPRSRLRLPRPVVCAALRQGHRRNSEGRHHVVGSPCTATV
jgi:hypothetical protein